MNTLKDYVNFKLTHVDKVAETEGYPLIMENCKKYKKMKEFMVFGNTLQDGTPTIEAPVEVQSVGDLVTDITDANYGKYKIPVVAKGKNMLKDVRDIYNGGGSQVANRYAEVIEDGRECISFTSANAIVYDKIKFKENTQYTFSFDCKDFVHQPSFTGTHDVPFGIWYTDGSKRYTTILKNQDWTRITVTSQANKTISYIGMTSYEWKTLMYIDINSFQIEEGVTATEYEPYIEPVTTNIYLDEPLRKIGNYADYLDSKGNKVVRNIGVGTSTAISVWREGSSHNTGIAWGLKNCDYRINTALCTHLKYMTESNGVSFRFIDGIYWYFDKTLFPTKADADRWIANRKADEIPLRFHYVLIAPTENSLNLDLPKLTANTTIIEVDTSLAPINAYGKYIKR